jgi:SSS family transporter
MKKIRYVALALIFCCSLSTLGRMVMASEIERLQWRTLPPLPQPSGGQMAGVANGTLLVIGGSHFDVPPWEGGAKIWLDQVFALEPAAREWKMVGHLPHPIGYGVAVSVDDSVIVIGGSDGIRHYSEVFRLRYRNGQLERTIMASLPNANANFGAALVGRTIYVTGGQLTPTTTEAFNSLWALDLNDQSPEWRILTPLPAAGRILPAAAGQDGTLFIASGAELFAGADGKSSRRYLRDSWRYHPTKGWSRISDAPRAVVAASALRYGQSHIFVFSGDDGANQSRSMELKENHPGFSTEVLAYHTITDTWSTFSQMPASLVTTAAVEWQNEIVITGGEDRPAHRSGTIFSARLPESRDGFDWLDYLVLGIYLLATMLVGFYFSTKSKTADEFFLGGRRVPWWAAGLSIYGTQLSALTYLAVPAKTYAEDWTYLLSNICIVIVAPIVIWFYLPFFRRLNITTAYEYLEQRFNLAVRIFGSASFIILQSGRLAIVLFLPALALSAVSGFNIYLCIVLMGVLTTIYTMEGGIQAVVWTDVVQVFVLIGGALAALLLLINGTDGGLSAIIATGRAAGKFHVLNLSWDATTTTVWVMIVGNLATHLIPYTTDQAVVQKYLTTSDEREAARGIKVNAVLTIPTALIFFSAGTALYAFYKSHPTLLNPAIQTDATFAWFIANQLPSGVAGLVLAGVFAAAMSTLSSSINSIATALVTDFYARLSPAVSDDSQIRLARRLSLWLGLIGTLVALLMAGFEIKSLWDVFLQIMGLFGSGLAGIFILGIFTVRTNARGAICGAITSAVVLFLVPRYTNLHFFLNAAIGIVTCVATGYLTSRLFPVTQPPLTNLTIHTRQKLESETG